MINLLRRLGLISSSHRTQRDFYACAIEVDVTDDSNPEWIRVLQAGEYINHPDGSHVVTRQHLQQMVEMQEQVATDLLVDVDHSSVFEGDTRAAGWIADLELRDDGLYARWPEWTPLGERLTEDREYRYLSPVYSLQTTQKDGSTGGARLFSIALTNEPYMDEGEITAISSRHDDNGDDGDSGDGEDDTFINNTTDTMREQLIEALDLDADVSDEELMAALQDAMEALEPATNDDGDGDDGDGTAASSRSRNDGTDDDLPADDLSTYGSEEASGDGDGDDDIQTIVNSAVERVLQQRDQSTRAEQLVDQAIADAKIEPAEREIFLNSARTDFEKTKARIDALEKGRATKGITISNSRTSTSTSRTTKIGQYIQNQL